MSEQVCVNESEEMKCQRGEAEMVCAEEGWWKC